ncbi:MAG: DUF1840 domain-containing protein [Zetaproteobacteria bacterium CG12_big_fil_rev_8_21_14_0_65_55_1124]|nr:MAG: hypothetical protein AUJ58_08740 [Zetaproteobacteria bacterium CG1_02_55_237]PIS20478.1 MAG: DUF1840 domain-containing protein [Zetaproteobacteria bacterium CG08_land_8_20_14_0_20_55_17]PIW43757.1 MAG: DUF1840 domain-containing protein [Zetaproteobacteria bacterium CG12_big_fil_rev_8_21_14_0_65_55_1124]PIY53292.1 MAG: DUF1840 domain-containing protein [Zetaproteobacteria bacterium CG_4_10_14_0_8_um_filter_55_43]PIZ40135.1 MAG: DUF1840 domain-containing protein [Zetaproteobacteria bacter
MPITFKTKTHAGITMLEDVALGMVKMMGHSPSVPGAILAADVPAALSRLKAAVEAGKGPSPVESDDPDEPAVSMAHRASPLIDLLSAATAAGDNVMWDTASITG